MRIFQEICLECRKQMDAVTILAQERVKQVLYWSWSVLDNYPENSSTQKLTSESRTTLFTKSESVLSRSMKKRKGIVIHKI